MTILKMANGQFYNADTGKIVSAPTSGVYKTGTTGQASTVNLDNKTTYNPNTGKTTQNIQTAKQQAEETNKLNPTLDPNKTPIPIKEEYKQPTITEGEAEAPQIFNRENITKNIIDSYQLAGGGALANEAFINGVSRLTRGRNASPEELGLNKERPDLNIKGASLDDVLKRFGIYNNIMARVPGMGVTQNKTIPGSNENPESQIPANKNIATDDGAVDYEKFTTNFLNDFDKINQEIINNQNELADYQNNTMSGEQKIGQQLGTTSALLQGEQLALQQQRALGENTLMKKIGIKEQEKANLIAKNQLQTQIEKTLYDRKRDLINDARNYRKDQQDALSFMLSFYPNGKFSEDLDPETKKLFEEKAKEAGIDPSMVLDGLDTIATDHAYEQNAAKIAAMDSLNSKQLSQIKTVSTSFDNSPIVKNFNDVQNKKLGVDNIIENGVGGPADLALVFDFMKALDPSSVVRESEYATAASSGNIFKGWAAKFNGYLSEKGGFLPDNVKEEFQNLVSLKFDAIQSQYKNLRDEKANQINIRTGRDDGLTFLIDYDFSPNGKKSVNPELNASYSTLEDLVSSQPEFLPYIEQLDNLYPDYSNEDILQIITGDGFNQVEGDTNITLNRPQRNMNPGNLKIGGIADQYAEKNNDGSIKVDDQNHLVFSSPEKGMEALKADLSAKINGRSRVVTNPDPTIADIGAVYAADEGWANSVARILGVSPHTRAQSIDFNKLVRAVATQEGFYA